MLRILALLAMTLPVLFAHPGHHQAETVVPHVLTQPDHLLVLGVVSVLALGISAAVLLRRRAQRVTA